MEKKIVLKKEDGVYKIPRFIRFKIGKNTKFYYEYNGKLYSKEKKDNLEVFQISTLVCALNIKKRKERLKYVYEKACDILDSDFYGKNLCEFKNNQCMHDRIHAKSLDGCCRTNDNSRKCKYIENHRCQTRCLACKFHVCYCLKQKGIKYKVNDLLVLKYLYTWKQKIIIYCDFFMTEEEVLKDVYRNSLTIWSLFTRHKSFVKNTEGN